MDEDLENRFTYHAPKDAIQVEKYARIRDIAKNYAYTIKDMTPASREQSLALTHLEECVFWSNAAMARHDTQEAKPSPPFIPFIRREEE